MNKNRRVKLLDTKVERKIVLSGLWVTVLFVFAFVDILGFWRSDIINGILAGTVSGTQIDIDQAFLVSATAYVLVPSLMIMVSLLMPARINRLANIIVSLVWFVSVVVMVLGESWSYYILGSVIEMLLLLSIAYCSWTWPRRTDQSAARVLASGSLDN